jgi:hypothetical protein
LVNFHRAVVVEKALILLPFDWACTSAAISDVVRIMIEARAPDLALGTLIKVQRQVQTILLEVTLKEVWYKWWLNLLSDDFIPIYATKPWMTLDFRD